MSQSTSHLRGILPALLLFSFSVNAQKIDWKKDTVANDIAKVQKESYRNIIKGSGQKATERVNFPVDKLKYILDACAANNIREISAYFTAIRPEDLSRYRANHPESSATDQQLLKSQLIIFKVPRSAFSGAMGAKINLSNHPTMISLLSMGLVLLDGPLGITGSAEDLYFDFGTICPPPTSCD